MGETIDRRRVRSIWYLVLLCIFVLATCLLLAFVMADSEPFVDVGMVSGAFLWLLCVIYWQSLRGLISPNIGTVILVLLLVLFAIYFSSRKSGKELLTIVFVGLVVYIAFNYRWARRLEQAGQLAQENRSFLERTKAFVGLGAGAAGIAGASLVDEGDGEEGEGEEDVQFDSPEARFEAWVSENARFVDSLLEKGKCLLQMQMDNKFDEGERETLGNLMNNLDDDNVAKDKKMAEILPYVLRMSQSAVLGNLADDVEKMQKDGTDIESARWKAYIATMKEKCKPAAAAKGKAVSGGRGGAVSGGRGGA